MEAEIDFVRRKQLEAKQSQPKAVDRRLTFDAQHFAASLPRHFTIEASDGSATTTERSPQRAKGIRRQTIAYVNADAAPRRFRGRNHGNDTDDDTSPPAELIPRKRIFDDFKGVLLHKVPI